MFLRQNLGIEDEFLRERRFVFETDGSGGETVAEKPAEEEVDAETQESLENSNELPQNLKDFLIELFQATGFKDKDLQNRVMTRTQELLSGNSFTSDQKDVFLKADEAFYANLLEDFLSEGHPVSRFFGNDAWTEKKDDVEYIKNRLAKYEELVFKGTLKHVEDSKSEELKQASFQSGTQTSRKKYAQFEEFEDVPRDIQAELTAILEEIDATTLSASDDVDTKVLGYEIALKSIFDRYKQHLATKEEISNELKNNIGNAEDCAELKLALGIEDLNKPEDAPTAQKENLSEVVSDAIQKGNTSLTNIFDYVVKNWANMALYLTGVTLFSKFFPGLTDPLVKRLPESETREVFHNLETDHWSLNMKSADDAEWTTHRRNKETATEWLRAYQVDGKNVFVGEATDPVINSLFNTEFTVLGLITLAGGGTDSKTIEEIDVPSDYVEDLPVLNAVLKAIQDKNPSPDNHSTTVAQYVAENLVELPTV